MAKKIENDKGFLVIEMSIEEAINICKFGSSILKWQESLNICDGCNNLITHLNKVVYYVAVMNSLFCEDCYKEWYEHAIYYKEDSTYEKRHYNRYARLLNMDVIK